VAVQLGGEDPDDPDLGDRGDEAVQSGELDDLAGMVRRVDELERLITGSGVPDIPPGLADGAVVTLRFLDGDEARFRMFSATYASSRSARRCRRNRVRRP
jgi:hypothetical protein